MAETKSLSLLLSPPQVAYFIYRHIKKRRKASARVGALPAPSSLPQPYQANAAWSLHAPPPGVVLAKHPPFFTQVHRDAEIAGMTRSNSDPTASSPHGVYRKPMMPGPIAQFYEGTAPPLAMTPPSSARQQGKAASAAASALPSYSANRSPQKLSAARRR